MIEHIPLDEVRRLEAACDVAAGPGHPASSLRPGVLSADAIAVSGTDGYLFISNGANRWEQQYGGGLAIPPAWTQAWIAVLAQRQSEAMARGIELINLVAPEKQAIYADKRWPDGAPDGSRRPMKHLLDQVGPDARLIYPEAALAAARAEAPAFHRHNSHWTVSGCAAVADQLLASLNAPLSRRDLRLAVERERLAHDLTVHFFHPAPEEDALRAAPPGAVLDDNRQFERTGRHTGATYRIENPAAPDPRRMVIFGDSYAYAAGLAAILAAAFAEVTCVWSKAVLWDVAAQRQAEVVVWESAERFLATVPKS